MPRKLYASVNGQTKQIRKLYGSVNGVTKEIVKLYGSAGGVTRQIFPDDSGPATETYLDYGITVNAKLKNLANGTTTMDEYSTDTAIRAFVKASALPTGFVPSTENTISYPDPDYEPIYIFFDSATGTMSYYTTATYIGLGADGGSMFKLLTSLTDISGLTNFGPNNQDMEDFFDGCSSLNDLTPLATWEVYGVRMMGNMFSGCSSLTDVSPLADWDTRTLQGMSYMFSGANDIDGRVLNNWDVSSVNSMSGAFTCPSHLYPTWYTP